MQLGTLQVLQSTLFLGMEAPRGSTKEYKIFQVMKKCQVSHLALLPGCPTSSGLITCSNKTEYQGSIY